MLSERESLGKAIRVRRTELDLSRGDLAEAAELSYPYLSEIENGGKWPSDKALRRLAEALRLEDAEALRRLAESYVSTDVPPPRPALRLESTSSPDFREAPEPATDRSGPAFAFSSPTEARNGTQSRADQADLDRVVENLVEERVRQELRRWQEDVLPLLIRAEVLEQLAERERD